MIDFNIPSKGLYIEKQRIYNINIPLRDEIQNSSFKKDWLLKLNYEYFEQLEKDFENIIVGDYRHKIHPYLRRFMSYGHSINFDLIKSLCSLGKSDQELNIGIAIDPEHIQSKNQIYFQDIELERAYGIQYDLSSIIKKLTHQFSTIKSVYFRSNNIGLKILIRLVDKNIIEFNIYEFTENKVNQYFINRSIHARFDITLNYFTHLDGKALLFDDENYFPLQIVFEDIKRKPKRKLFRIDGKITNRYFMTLTSEFFFENDIISEFFNPEKVEKNIIENMET